MIKISGISKSFGQKRVLEDLNLEVKPKEILSLLGPNGSGKTTLLNLIAGLAKPDQGSISIDGVIVSDSQKRILLKPSERSVGYVFQTTSLFPHMRLEDNVAFGLKSMHISEADVKKRVAGLLDFVELREYAKCYPSQLSGGQKQRAALARSLATEPKVLLLDEPVSAVDPQLREQFRIELKNYLRKLNVTVIYVTHNLSEAFVMSDRIAVLGNGRIEQIGNGDEIFDRPSSSYVAKFLGINTFAGRALGLEGGFLRVEAKGNLLSAPPIANLVGKDVTVTLKPEDITLAKQEDTSAVTNCIEGLVVEMIHMRSTAQIVVDVGFQLKARLPLKSVKRLALVFGDRVKVCFSADSLNVFADGSNTLK